MPDPSLRPEPPAFGLFGGDFQPLTSPDPFNALLVHRLPGATQQRRNPAIAVAAAVSAASSSGVVGIFLDHVTAELGISERRACRALGQHRSTRMCGAGSGLEVSLCGLRQNELIRRQVRYRPPETGVLGL